MVAISRSSGRRAKVKMHSGRAEGYNHLIRWAGGGRAATPPRKPAALGTSSWVSSPRGFKAASPRSHLPRGRPASTRLCLVPGKWAPGRPRTEPSGRTALLLSRPHRSQSFRCSRYPRQRKEGLISSLMEHREGITLKGTATPDPGPHPDPTGPRLTGSARLLAYSLRAGPNPGPTGTPCAAPGWPPTLHSWLATQQPLAGKRSLAPGRAAPAFASRFTGWPCLVHQGQPQCPEQDRLLKQSVGPRGQRERRGPWPDPWGGRCTRGPDFLAQREDGGAVGRGAEGSGRGQTPPRDPRALPRAPLSGEGAGGASCTSADTRGVGGPGHTCARSARTQA